MLRRLSTLTSFLFVSFFANLQGICDVIILKNDEVLKGKVLSKESNTLVFRTEDGRTVSIDEKQVGVIEFVSDKVVEVQLNGKRVKGVEVGETKEGIIVKTAFGEHIVRRSQVKEVRLKTLIPDQSIVFITNYVSITNEVLKVITNFVGFTNFVTNYFTNSITNVSVNNVTSESEVDRKVRFLLSIGLCYDFLNFYPMFISGVRARLFNRGNFTFYLGRAWLGFVGGYGISYEPFGWLELKLGMGGFFALRSSYFLASGLEILIDTQYFQLLLPVEVMFVGSSNTVVGLGLGASF
ncbi:MAG: hypothetical protein ABDH28_04835 [Brevinematia bacterium]